VGRRQLELAEIAIDLPKAQFRRGKVTVQSCHAPIRIDLERSLSPLASFIKAPFDRGDRSHITANQRPHSGLGFRASQHRIQFGVGSAAPRHIAPEPPTRTLRHIAQPPRAARRQTNTDMDFGATAVLLVADRVP
jgi:hypothetical protein